MTQNLREAELFLSHAGSDCGIANVNIGHPVQKLAEHSVEKKKPEAEENPDRMRGNIT